MVDPAKNYPPATRDMDVFYDHVAGRAKVIVNDGVSAEKAFLRLYESNKEYAIRQGQEFPSCRRSYLGE